MYFQAIIKKMPWNKKGTYLKLFIPNEEINEKYFIDGIAKGELRIDDERLITASQRGLLYSLFKDIERKLIADGSQVSVEEVKESLKARFCLDKNEENFSLSNVKLTKASDFIDYVLDFTFVYGVPLKFKTFQYAKEWRSWSYTCFKYRECTICRKKGAHVHHIDSVGRGVNRNRVDHSKKLLIMLCPHHHHEAHAIGDDSFSKKYHVAGIFVDVATLKALNIKGDYGEEANV